jgi:hypothetical protein
VRCLHRDYNLSEFNGPFHLLKDLKKASHATFN